MAEKASNQPGGSTIEDLMSDHLENYFKTKLLKFHANLPADVLENPQKPDSSTQTAEDGKLSTVDLQKKMMDFLTDFGTFVNDESDLMSFKDEDEEEDNSDTESSNEDAESASGVGEEMSLLDLNEEALEKTLSHEMKPTKAESDEELKIKVEGKDFFRCKFCYQFVDMENGNFNKALTEHRATPFHIEAEKRLRKERNEKKEEKGGDCSIIIKNDQDDFICTLCNYVNLGKTRKNFLVHCQSQQHQDNLIKRFPQKLEKNAAKPTKKPTKKVKKPEKPTKTDQNENQEREEKDNNLAYAVGMATIQPISQNQMKCTMCDKIIPVAKEFSALMKNVSMHIQGSTHVKNLAQWKSQIDKIKEENPTIKQKLQDKKPPPYKFFCLICDFNGYNEEFCKKHMTSSDHSNRVKQLIGVDAGIPVNFDKGVRCKCGRFIFGTVAGIKSHVSNCKEQPPKKVRTRTPRPKQPKQPKQPKKVDGQEDEEKKADQKMPKFKPKKPITGETQPAPTQNKQVPKKAPGPLQAPQKSSQVPKITVSKETPQVEQDFVFVRPPQPQPPKRKQKESSNKDKNDCVVS